MPPKHLAILSCSTHSQQSTVNCQQSTVNSQQSTANSQQSTVNSQQPTVNSQQSTVNRQQSTVNNHLTVQPELISQLSNLIYLLDLRNYGFKVLVALDGESAIEQTEYIHPDLILLDIMMPGIDGFETCRRLKADPPTRDIPIIFMSALSDTIDKVKGFQAGAVDYITKPFQHEEVLSRIETHLTIRSLQKKLQEKNAELAHLNQNLERLIEQKTKQLIDQEKTAIIGRLTQGMVHNLKSPLQVIQTSVDLIETKATKIQEDSFYNYTKYIIQSVTKINQIMDTLMIKSRKEQNQDLQLVNINDLVQRELQLLEGNLYFRRAN